MNELALPVPVIFYLPFTNDGIVTVPSRVEDYWPWLSRHRRVGGGKYAWTLQTYLHLRDAGVSCQLANRFPTRGIVISHRDFLPVFLRPRVGVFLICIKPDRQAHTWAHYYIVQNGHDSVRSTRKGRNRTTVLPVWPQPALIPRRADRGDLCRNVAYFGRNLNLADELKAHGWRRELAALDFNWSVPSLEHWNDYSAVDVTLSVRSFGGEGPSTDPVFDANSKPPSKLINSWIAGVPAIVGRESAYESIRESPLDYLDAGTPDEAKEALIELRTNRHRYHQMVAHGRLRARDFTAEALSRRWQAMLRFDVSAAYAEWRRQGPLQRGFASARGVINYLTRVEHWRHLNTISRKQRHR